jgi:hypothetical protein
VLNRGRDWSRPRTDYSGITIDKRGRILVAGIQGNRSTLMVRFKANGTVDKTFGRQGRVVRTIRDRSDIPTIGGLVPLPDGGAVVMEGTYSKVRVLRLSNRGFVRKNATIAISAGQPISLDSSRNQSGAIIGGFMSIDPRNKRFNNAGEAVTFRLTKQGKLDRRFGNRGILRFNPKKATNAFGGGSAIYFRAAFGLGGSANGAIVSTSAVKPGEGERTISFRLNSDGSIDRGFGTAGVFYSGGTFSASPLPVVGLADGATLVTAGGQPGVNQSQQHLYRFVFP